MPASGSPAAEVVPHLHVGCAMWAHRDWAGRFVPPAGGGRRQLAAYASWCTAVEGNTTFYGVPSPRTVAAWADQAPGDFRFVCKLPRRITHELRLRQAGPELAAFLRALAPLGERLWTVTAQLPGSFGPPDLGVLAAFLHALPPEQRFAVEVRHPRFFDGSPAARALADLVGGAGVEWVPFDTTALFAAPPTSDAEREAWTNKPRVPRRTAAVTDRPVVRYLGRDDPAATVAGWRPWIGVVAGWLAEGRSPTVFVHTPDNVDAPELARRFHDEVRAVVPALAALPTPVPLDASPATLF